MRRQHEPDTFIGCRKHHLVQLNVLIIAPDEGGSRCLDVSRDQRVRRRWPFRWDSASTSAPGWMCHACGLSPHDHHHG